MAAQCCSVNACAAGQRSASLCVVCGDGCSSTALLSLHCSAAAKPGAIALSHQQAASRSHARSSVRRLYAWPADCPNPAQTLFEGRGDLYRSFAHPAVVALMGAHLVAQSVLDATRCCLNLPLQWKHLVVC